jgi:hypothetical protein
VDCLYSLGTNDSAAASALAEESKFSTELDDVSEFREAVLSGNWVKAEDHIAHIPLRQNASPEQVLFLIREQKFMESLEDKNFTAALNILRTELSPLNIDIDKVHNLSRYLLFLSSLM